MEKEKDKDPISEQLELLGALIAAQQRAFRDLVELMGDPSKLDEYKKTALRQANVGLTGLLKNYIEACDLKNSKK